MAGDGMAPCIIDTGQTRLELGQDGIVRISNRPAAEIDLAEAQQSLLALGQLAGGKKLPILVVILGLASVLQHELPGDSPWLADARNIVDAARRGKSLVQNMLGFARKGLYPVELFSLNEVVAESRSMIELTLPKRSFLELDLQQGLPEVKGDPTAISQALMNICLNSADAIEGSGQITISTGEVALGSEEAHAVDPDLTPGRYLKLTVTDDGAGMPQEICRRAVEPFFTTKEPGKGSGLGLSMVYGTAKSHGGALALQSAPGQGTQVTLFLPALVKK